MSAPTVHARTAPPRDFVVTAVVGSAVVVGLLSFVSVGDPSSAASEAFGIGAALGFVLFAIVACARGASRRNRYSRAWLYLTVALLLSGTSSAMTIFSQLTTAGEQPFPTISDYAYLAYVVPSVAALLAMPKPVQLRVSRWRSVLDALVIILGLLLLSWATVLESVVSAAPFDRPAGWVMTASPVIDVIICSAVLTLGMRQPPGERLTWWLLGGGLVTLTVTDSVYVALVNLGTPNLGTHPLIAGWMVAPLLVALATMVRPSPQLARVRAARVSIGLEFIPYVPVVAAVAAVVAMAVRDLDPHPIPLTIGALMLTSLLIRQVMIVFENLRLTADLKKQVNELAQLGSIVTSSRDAIVGISTDGRVTSTNPAAEELFGLSAAETIGQQAELISPGELDQLHLLIEGWERGEAAAAQEMDWVKPNGDRVRVALAISPIMHDGVFLGVSVSARDITEATLAAAALVQAREDALESSRLKSEFLATMSHEIRTPMNGVIGLTGLLLETPLNQVQRQYADGVNTAGQALLAVINDVLDFSKLEAGKVELELVDFSARQLVADVGALLAPAAADKRLQLSASCLPTVPEVLHGDVGRIRQILLNLAFNAVKFTSSGQVSITVAVAEAGDQQLLVRFEVSDTGIGVAEESRALLFQAFSQGDASTTRRYGGTGLGLAISSRLVEAMAGRIDLESQPGVGSTFWFEIPLALGDPAATDLAEPAPGRPGHLLPRPDGPAAPAPASGSLGRILVVEDNALNQLVAEGMVARLGYQVNIVANGVQALEALSSTSYAAVLMDCHMPIMDGFEATREIRRRRDHNTGIPIIAMTAGAMAEDRERCVAAGMNDYVAKPIDLDTIGQLLRTWVPSAPGPEVDRVIDQQRLADLRGLGSFQGSDLLGAVVQVFNDQAPASLSVLRESARVGAAHELKQAAHHLRGAAENIGAIRVAALCLELELLAHPLDPAGTWQLVDQLRVELDVATLALEQALPSAP